MEMEMEMEMRDERGEGAIQKFDTLLAAYN
jgi:hypothetical protein